MSKNYVEVLDDDSAPAVVGAAGSNAAVEILGRVGVEVIEVPTLPVLIEVITAGNQGPPGPQGPVGPAVELQTENFLAFYRLARG